MSTILGQPSAVLNFADAKRLDNSVQPDNALDKATQRAVIALCSTPDKEGEPGLPVNIFRHGIFQRTHTIEDPRFLWCQRFNSVNRRAGLHAELAEERDANAVDSWEPVPEPLQPTVAEVYSYFAPLVGTRCCVAGGAVRDELLGRTPRDFDVFTFGPFDRDAILAGGAELIENQLTRYGSRTLAEVLTVRWRGVTVQVIFRGDGNHDVDSLLDSFDLECCLFAYDEGGIVRRMDPAKIGPDNLLRLNPTGAATRTAARTLQRAFKFCERYDCQLDDGDLVALCAEIVEGYAATHAMPSTKEIVGG